MDDCPSANAGIEEDATGRRLQQGQPLLLTYGSGRSPREVFGEVRMPLKRDLDLVRLYLDDGQTDAILLRFKGRGWRDVTNAVQVRVAEELSGAQLSRFMLYRDYAFSGCAQSRQPALKRLRASA